MPYADGLAFATVGAFAFGVQYVPVKKYEVFDSTTFQWFMCTGILFTGALISAFIGEAGTVIRPCIYGGILWGISNYIVIPLVQLLGMGLGFGLYHFVNLLVGYSIGRFGLFGMPRMEPSVENGVFYCDFACLVLLAGFIIMVFVDSEDQTPNERIPLAPRIIENSEEDIEEFRKRYRQWRRGEASRRSRDEMEELELAVKTVGTPRQRLETRFVQFGVYGTIKEEEQETIEDADEASSSHSEQRDRRVVMRSNTEPNFSATRREESESDLRSAKRVRNRKLWGICLALSGGTLCGVNGVPSSLYLSQNVHVGPFSTVFSQCLGIWMASTAIYLTYSAVALVAKFPVQHSLCGPAGIS